MTLDETVQEQQVNLTPASLPPSSLLICSRNRPKLLGDLVDTILKGDEVPSEIIIVDDSDVPHETLGSLMPRRPCEIRYQWTHSRGLSRANNRGVAEARHELLVFTQDDVLVEPSWYGTIVRALLESGQNVVVTGQVKPGEPEQKGGFAPSTVAAMKPTLYRGRIGADVLYVQNMAVYRSTVLAAGGFDERIGPGTPFPSAEDNDFAYRLLGAGYAIIFEPRSVTYHRAWRGSDEVARLNWNYGLGQGAFYAKHLNFKDRHILKRVLGDFITYSGLFVRHIWRYPRVAVGHIILMAGMVYGGILWHLKTRGTRN